MEIMNASEGVGGQFVGLEEMMKVGEGEMLAGPAGATVLDGAEAICVFGFRDF